MQGGAGSRVSGVSGDPGVQGAVEILGCREDGGSRGAGVRGDLGVQAGAGLSLLPPQLLCCQCLKELRVPLPLSPGIFIYFNSLGTFRDFFPSRLEGGARRAWPAFLLSPDVTLCSLCLAFGSWAPSSVGRRQPLTPEDVTFPQPLPSSWRKMHLLQAGFALPVPLACVRAAPGLPGMVPTGPSRLRGSRARSCLCWE